MHSYSFNFDLVAKIERLTMDADEEIEGFRIVAQALSKLGVKYMFGVVGIPVIEVEGIYNLALY